MKKNMNKQRTIGLNPLEEYLSGASSSQTYRQESYRQEKNLEQELAQEIMPEESVEEASIGVTEPLLDHVQANQDVISESISDSKSNISKISQEQLSVSAYNMLNFDSVSAVKKQRVTIHVPEALIDKVKDAVYWEPGLTLAGFAEYALVRALEEVEQERGESFPSRRRKQLRGGRPIK